MNKNIFYNNNSENVYFFGTGEWVKKSLDKGIRRPEAILDNNQRMHGKYLDLDVIAPKEILEKEEPITIVITTSSYDSVLAEINKYGFKLGENVFISPVLEDIYNVNEVKRVSKNILFTCSDIPNEESDKSGGGLYEYDFTTSKKRKVYSGKMHQVITYKDKYYIADEFYGVIVLNKHYELVDKIKSLENSIIHGIAINPKKEHIYLANAGRDSISIIDLKTKEFIDEIFIGSDREDFSDKHHINDLYFYQGNLYVSMFSVSGLWRENYYDGAIVQLDAEDYEKRRFVRRELLMPHSVHISSNELVYVDSLAGELYLSKGNRKLTFNGFIRGLINYDKYIILAQSEHRYLKRLDRDNKCFSINCGIYVIDKENKASRFHSIPDLMNIHSLIERIK